MKTKKFILLIAILALGFPFSAAVASTSSRSDPGGSAAAAFSNLDLEAARRQSNLELSHDPNNPIALLVRMEVAELEARTDVMLDSALRLCSAHVPENLANIASARILEHAENTPAFRAIIPRIEAAAQHEDKCAFKLRLALVAAAADGNPSLDLDHTATVAGLLTRWRLAGPFGRYSNADFDRDWPPELDHFSLSSYGELQAEELWWRDGLFTLPDYLSAAGIFYAASDVETKTGHSLLSVFSLGTYSVFVDGKLVLAHDTRYVVGSGQDSVALNLSAGKHQVMMKFTPEAAPFRVAIRPQNIVAAGGPAFNAGPLHSYIEALDAYFRDDLPALARVLPADSSRAMKYLRALLDSAVEGNSSRTRAAWKAVAPAPLARIRLAEMTAEDDSSSNDDLLRQASDLAGSFPQSEAAQQLAFAVSHQEDALKRLLVLHPSCSNLSETLNFFSAGGGQDEIADLEKRLANCAPDSLVYAEMLSAAGRHSEAADYLLNLLNTNALNRATRRMVIQELLLADPAREKEAAQQAETLHRMAPNSAAFTQLTSDPYNALNANSVRAHGFTAQNQFYLPYRRSAWKIIPKASERSFAGGPSLTVLFDKVIEVNPGGSISIYTHRITRLLTKDGISRFGEVMVPRGADLLELRTIKSAGQIIEPELTLQKPTVSMPALEPGDSIEEEFVVHYHDWDEMPAEAAEFTFGSFSAPVLYSRLVVIAPEGAAFNKLEANDAPRPHVEHTQGITTEIWERNDIAQSPPESDLPPENQLPFIAVAPAENGARRLRDDWIAATRVGIQVESVARNFQGPAKTDYARARDLYHFVSSRIQSSAAEWSANNAEDTLLNSEGSRTAVLLALARAAGFKVKLMLARKIGQHCPENWKFSCYTLPVVRFWLANSTVVDTDVESDLAFGVIPSDLNAEDALLVPVTQKEEARPLHVALMRTAGNEKSVAEGELFLDESGNMSMQLHVRLGAARGLEVRNLLRRSNQQERQMFFDQLATRIFPGAAAVTGASSHEDDPEQPLELTLRCQAPRVVNSTGSLELDQLVPALGLRELYATSDSRKFPLYLASVLFENATFHLHLAGAFELHSLPADFSSTTEFGNYSVHFSAGAHEITIHREFRIPVQIVPVQKYAAFANFARQIDEAESGKITIGFHAATASLFCCRSVALLEGGT